MRRLLAAEGGGDMSTACTYPGCTTPSIEGAEVFCAETSAHLPYGRRVPANAICLVLTSGEMVCIKHLDEHWQAEDIRYFGPRPGCT